MFFCLTGSVLGSLELLQYVCQPLICLIRLSDGSHCLMESNCPFSLQIDHLVYSLVVGLVVVFLFARSIASYLDIIPSFDALIV